MATFGPWVGVPANMQRACAVEGCHEEGKPHACPYDGAMHHHGCIHYLSHQGTVGLTFRDGWGWLCDTHYQTIMADLARHQDAPHQMPHVRTSPLQESAEKKAAWLDDAEKRIPVGTRIKVVTSDVDDFKGTTGVVSGYDLGGDGVWPIVSVTFDTPITHEGHVYEHDGFYCDGSSDDEIVPCEPPMDGDTCNGCGLRASHCECDGPGESSTLDVWGKLWDAVTDGDGVPPTIEVDRDNPGRVILVYPDGERTALRWDDGQWQDEGEHVRSLAE